MAQPFDIVGYIYKADTYCPAHIVQRLPTGPSEDFDGWALAHGVTMTAEENLDEIAAAFGIDREDERTFDSDYFPKVVFRDIAEDHQCAVCGGFLDGRECGFCDGYGGPAVTTIWREGIGENPAEHDPDHVPADDDSTPACESCAHAIRHTHPSDRPHYYVPEL